MFHLSPERRDTAATTVPRTTQILTNAGLPLETTTAPGYWVSLGWWTPRPRRGHEVVPTADIGWHRHPDPDLLTHNDHALLALRGDAAWARRYERRALQDRHEQQMAARAAEQQAELRWLLTTARETLEAAGWITVKLGAENVDLVPPEYADIVRDSPPPGAWTPTPLRRRA